MLFVLALSHAEELSVHSFWTASKDRLPEVPPSLQRQTASPRPPRPQLESHTESNRKARIFGICLQAASSFHYHRHPTPDFFGLRSCFSFLRGRQGGQQHSVVGRFHGLRLTETQNLTRPQARCVILNMSLNVSDF